MSMRIDLSKKEVEVISKTLELLYKTTDLLNDDTHEEIIGLALDDLLYDYLDEETFSNCDLNEYALFDDCIYVGRYTLNSYEIYEVKEQSDKNLIFGSYSVPSKGLVGRSCESAEEESKNTFDNTECYFPF